MKKCAFVILGTYSGEDLPPSVTAYSGSMYLQFSTDASWILDGWTATWNSSNPPKVPIRTQAASGGQATGSGSYWAGSNTTLNATAFGDYAFSHWSDSATGVVVARTAQYEFTVTAMRTFVAHFIRVCGHNIYTASSGTFSDGSGNLDYLTHLNCSWLIAPQGAATVTLDFTTFATESGLDTVRVFDGRNPRQGILLGKYAGNALPPSLTALSGAMYIDFHTDASVGQAGWSAQWSSSTTVVPTIRIETSVSAPGGIVSGGGTYRPTDLVTIQAFPHVGNRFLRWKKALTGQVVSFEPTFTFFASEFNGLIEADFGLYCGSWAYWEPRGTVTDGSGSQNYQDDANCNWSLSPVGATAIRFTLTEKSIAAGDVLNFSGDGTLLASFSNESLTLPHTFTLPFGYIVIGFATANDGNVAGGWSLNWEAIYDRPFSVRVRAAQSNQGVPTILPNRSVFLGETVTVRANPNSPYALQAWVDSTTGQIVSTETNYTFTASRSISLIARYGLPCQDTVLAACRGTVQDGSGSSAYGNNLNCSWLIRPQNASHLTLTFREFATIAGDTLFVYDGTAQTGVLLGKYAGSALPPRLVATTGSLFLKFITNGSQVATGWIADWSCSNGGSSYRIATRANVGGSVTGSNIYFAGDTVTVTATALAGYVFTHWSDSTTGQRVSMQSRYGFTARQAQTLNAHFVRFCSTQTFTTATGTFTDGSDSLNYAANSDCSWLIQPSNRAGAIQLTFNAFNLTPYGAYLSVYDGNTANERLLGTYSGSNLPPSLVARSGSMYIRLVSGSAPTQSGFAAEWTSSNAIPHYVKLEVVGAVFGEHLLGEGHYIEGDVASLKAITILGSQFVAWVDETGQILSRDTFLNLPIYRGRIIKGVFGNVCVSGVMTERSGTFSDGSGHRPYGFDNRCSWLLSPTRVTGIDLAFTAFDIDLTDSVIVYDGENLDPWNPSPILGVFKGNQLPPVLHSTGNKMLIVLESDRTISGAGFEARWTSRYPNTNIVLTAAPDSCGTLTGGGVLELGTPTTVRAQSRMGWRFTHWSENGVMVSDTTSYEFFVTRPRQLTAHFAVHQRRDTIGLRANWSLVGLNVIPLDNRVEQMFAPIVNRVGLIKSMDGRIYMPSLGVNTLTHWNSLEGYRSEMRDSGQIVVLGEPIDRDFEIPFRTGWQIIPYVRREPMPITELFGRCLYRVDMVKAGDGAMWIPDLGINQIGNAKVGQAYQVKFNSDGVLTQLSRRLGGLIGDRPLPQQLRLTNVSTGNNAGIILRKSVFENVLQVGDEIGVFTPQGFLCGSVLWEGQNAAIAVHGDDEWTTELDGIRRQEPYQLFVQRKGTDHLITMDVQFERGVESVYQADQLSYIKWARLRIVSRTAAEVPVIELWVYPNPTQGDVYVRLVAERNQKVSFRLLNGLGQMVKNIGSRTVLTDTHLEKLDLNELPNGIYWLETRVGSEIIMRRVQKLE